MSGEKMAILKMLEEGKITAENATNLLAALGDDNGKSNGAGGTAETDGREFGSQRKYADGKAASGWATDLGRKIEVVAKDLEPKIQKLAGVVIEKSVGIADAATKSVQQARERGAEREKFKASAPPRPEQRTPGGVYSGGAGGGSTTESKTFELDVSPDLPNEITLKSPKGSINIKGYNGDKATLNVSYRRSVAGRDIEFLKLGCVYQLNYDADAYDNINLDVFIPFGMFKRLTLETEGGDVLIDNVDSAEININTVKCHVSVKNVKTGVLKIDNLNGAVLLSGLSGDELTVENANGTIDASNTDFRNMRLETTAEPVSVISQGFYKHNNYNWLVRTSNARMKASLPVSTDLGYEIKAYTSLSDVSNGLSGLNYTRNDRNCIEGKTEGYETKAKKVKIELDTSNAPLNIN